MSPKNQLLILFAVTNLVLSAATNETSVHPQDFRMNITEGDKSDFQGSQEVGHWAVYDTAEIVSAGQDSPCCMLAKMGASVTMKLRSGKEALFDLPASARNLNDTCMNKGFGTQWLNLTWVQSIFSNPSSDALFSFSFDTKSHYAKNGTSPRIIVPGVHFLSGIFFSVPVNLSKNAVTELGLDNKFNSTTGGFIDFRIFADVRGLYIFEAPKLFAYSCKRRFVKLSMPASILTNGHSAGTKVNAEMTLTNLELEPFRKERFYTDFTHLKFDCVNGWPYEKVVEIVNGGLGCFVVIALIAMVFRVKRQKAKELENEMDAEKHSNS